MKPTRAEAEEILAKIVQGTMGAADDRAAQALAAHPDLEQRLRELTTLQRELDGAGEALRADLAEARLAATATDRAAVARVLLTPRPRTSRLLWPLCVAAALVLTAVALAVWPTGRSADGMLATSGRVHMTTAADGARTLHIDSQIPPGGHYDVELVLDPATDRLARETAAPTFEIPAEWTAAIANSTSATIIVRAGEEFVVGSVRLR